MKRSRRHKTISSEGAFSLAKRLHFFISSAGATSLKKARFRVLFSGMSVHMGIEKYSLLTEDIHGFDIVIIDYKKELKVWNRDTADK